MEAEAQNYAEKYLLTVAPQSRRTLGSSLDSLARILTADDDAVMADVSWEKLTVSQVNSLREVLDASYAPRTISKMLSALRGSLRQARLEGKLAHPEVLECAGLGTVQGIRRGRGRSLVASEVEALVATCGDSALGRRDAAMLAVLSGCGLQRQELVDLEYSDVDLEYGSLVVTRQSGARREIPLSQSVALQLSAWLDQRGNKPGPLFVGLNNRNMGGRLTTQAIYKLVRERCLAAGISVATPNDLRRTFIRGLVNQGHPLEYIGRLAGHRSVANTALYTVEPIVSERATLRGVAVVVAEQEAGEAEKPVKKPAEWAVWL